MLKKEITYTDYDGEKRTETFYFNISKAEAYQMQLKSDGKLVDRLQEIVESKDPKELVSFLEEFILLAYGEKSEDGRRFVKSAELSEQFSQTEAFSELFMELATVPDESEKFVKGVLSSILSGINLDNKIENNTNN